MSSISMSVTPSRKGPMPSSISTARNSPSSPRKTPPGPAMPPPTRRWSKPSPKANRRPSKGPRPTAPSPPTPISSPASRRSSRRSTRRAASSVKSLPQRLRRLGHAAARRPDHPAHIHESMDHAGNDGAGDRDAGTFETLGVSLPLIEQRVAGADDDERRGETAMIGRANGRSAPILEIPRSDIIEPEPFHRLRGQQEPFGKDEARGVIAEKIGRGVIEEL